MKYLETMSRRREITEWNKKAPCRRQLYYYGIYCSTYIICSNTFPSGSVPRRDRNREAAWCVGVARVAFSIQFLRRMKGGKSREIRPFVSHSQVSRVSRFCQRYEQRWRKRASAENFVGAACVTGIGLRLSRSVYGLFFWEDETCLLFATLEMTSLRTPVVSTHTALWRKFVNKSLLTVSRGSGGCADLVGWHGFHAFAMEMRDAGKVENSGPIRGRKWRWLAEYAFNAITHHFATPWCVCLALWRNFGWSREITSNWKGAWW